MHYAVTPIGCKQLCKQLWSFAHLACCCRRTSCRCDAPTKVPTAGDARQCSRTGMLSEDKAQTQTYVPCLTAPLVCSHVFAAWPWPKLCCKNRFLLLPCCSHVVRPFQAGQNFGYSRGGRGRRGGARGGGRGNRGKGGRPARFGGTGMCWPLRNILSQPGPASAYTAPPPPRGNQTSKPNMPAAPAVAIDPSNNNKAAAAALRARIIIKPKVPTAAPTAAAAAAQLTSRPHPPAAAIPGNAATAANPSITAPVKTPQKLGCKQGKQPGPQSTGIGMFPNVLYPPPMQPQSTLQHERHPNQPQSTHLFTPPKRYIQPRQQPQGRPYQPPALNLAMEEADAETMRLPQNGQQADFERDGPYAQKRTFNGRFNHDWNADFSTGFDGPQPGYDNGFQIPEVSEFDPPGFGDGSKDSHFDQYNEAYHAGPVPAVGQKRKLAGPPQAAKAVPHTFTRGLPPAYHNKGQAGPNDAYNPGSGAPKAQVMAGHLECNC